MKKRLAIILMLSCSIAGCSPDFDEHDLMDMSEISLVWKNEIQVAFKEGTGQLGYNDRKNEFRVYDDKLANWFTVRCSHKPSSVGQDITADVSWTGTKSTQKQKGLKFKVKQISAEGMIWLWCKNDNIGIIVKDIE